MSRKNKPAQESELRQKNESLEAKIQQLSKELDELRSYRAVSLAVFPTIKKEFDKLHESDKKYKEAHEGTAKVMHESLKNEQELRQQVSTLQSRINKLKETNSGLETRNSSLARQLAEANNKIRRLTEEKEALQADARHSSVTRSDAFFSSVIQSPATAGETRFNSATQSPAVKGKATVEKVDQNTSTTSLEERKPKG